MGEIENPFADNVNALPAPHNDPMTMDGVIRRLAEIEDELSRRGIDPLVEERESLRKGLKQQMLKSGLDSAYDEISGYEAVIVRRTSDVWDVGVFKLALSPTQRARYIVESVSEGAVGDGIKSGDLSRPTLEKAGAVKKQVGSKALYVRLRKEESKED